jgi:osmotically-inducible protein OsmY
MIVVAGQSTQCLIVTRYDRKLYHAAVAALAASKYAALRRLNCSVSAGVVEISGTVSSFYLKQLAQAAVMQLDAVDGVRNLVEVSGESPVVVATHCGAVESD